MSSLISYPERKILKYQKDLRLVASLSNLFSDSETPLIYYRATENIYCDSFDAKNVSRNDSTADAVLGKYGIGIKTFIKGSNSQKIAEFNKQRELYSNLRGLDLAKKISDLRNGRIEFTENLYNVDTLIYHLIVRSPGHIDVYEQKLNRIDVAKIKIVSEDETKIIFEDGIEQYEFYHAKSTLLKQFKLDEPFISIDVEIMENPMESLRSLAGIYAIKDMSVHYSTSINGKVERLIIPLYSVKKGIKFVAEKSGLNQWRASGRQRDENEVYIPYPVKIRRECPKFFPDRKTKWELALPNGKTISMKVCQQDGKALMSRPNKALGKWLLRDVLKLPSKTPLTYEKLLEIGIDSVVFTKKKDQYSVDFIDSNSFED